MVGDRKRTSVDCHFGIKLIHLHSCLLSLRGVMLKLLLILALVVYVLSKVGGLFFKAGAASQHFRPQQKGQRAGNSNVNSAPPKDKKGGTIKGGDYVDYEEVK